MSRDGWRPRIEGLRCLNLTRMLQAGAVKPNHLIVNGGWNLCDPDTYERLACIGYSADLDEHCGYIRLQYVVTDHGTGERRDRDYTIKLSSVPLHYGGRRWYFHCPATGRRALKLFLVQSTFVARAAILPLPTYRSQRVSGLDRVIDQRWTLRRRMGDTFSDLYGAPLKPKGMHRKTFERYAARDAELEEIESLYTLRRWGMLADRLGAKL